MRPPQDLSISKKISGGVRPDPTARWIRCPPSQHHLLWTWMGQWGAPHRPWSKLSSAIVSGSLWSLLPSSKGKRKGKRKRKYLLSRCLVQLPPLRGKLAKCLEPKNLEKPWEPLLRGKWSFEFSRSLWSQVVVVVTVYAQRTYNHFERFTFLLPWEVAGLAAFVVSVVAGFAAFVVRCLRYWGNSCFKLLVRSLGFDVAAVPAAAGAVAA